MKTPLRFRWRTLATCAGLSLAPVVAAPFADTAVGVGTVVGDTLTASAQASRPLDADWVKAKHTPTGQMFKWPLAMPSAKDIQKSASGWEYSGQLEFGLIGGDADERNAQYRTYQDIDNGAYVNNFSLQMRKPENGQYLELTGGGAGRHDQYYGLQFGRSNDWKLKVFFSEIPHVFTDRYKSLWNGVGTGNLTLLPGLTPGGTASTTADNANVTAAATGKPMTTLGLTRKKGGARLDLDLSKTWKAYVGYSVEKREGARPFGAVWGNAGGTAPIEIAEPIDYKTQDILAGMLYADGLNAFNLRFSGSLFDNNIDTLTFQEPYRIAPPGGVTTTPAAGAYTQGRFDLTPSNRAYNARAEYTRSFPDFYRSQLTAVVSGGRWRQDDDLIPYTSIPNLVLTNVTVQPGGNWDTVGALSRKSAAATIDTRLADLSFSVNPTDELNLKARARFNETKNNTNPFLAVNPNAVYIDADAATAGNQTRGLTLDGVTGVWGRLINDGSGQNILLGANANPAGNIPIKSNYYDSKQYRFGPAADYRLSKVSSVNATFEREITLREHRERNRTWEDRTKIGYVNRGLHDATVRFSYEFDRRRGSTYVASSYDSSFSSALFPIPTTAGTNVSSWVFRNNSGFRAFDLSDRDQHVANLRVDTMLRPNLDAGVSVQAKETQFPEADYGRTKQGQRSANLDLNYQPSPQRSVYFSYSYQIGKYRQASIQSTNNQVTIGLVTPLGTVTPANAVAIGAAPGGPIFPVINAWTSDGADRNHVLSLGLKQDFGKASLNVDYSYSTGRTRIEYGYNIGGALNAANAAFAGARMPDMATDTNYLDASLRIPLTPRLAARLTYRYQKEVIRDWHYQNLNGSPVVLANNNAAAVPTSIQLDGGPYGYLVNWCGVTFELKF